MRLPPLFDDRTSSQQVVLGVVVPSAFGAVTGVLLGVSAPVYLLLSILGVAGGYGAGLEHRGAGDGATRGFAGGLLFGSFILAAHEATGMEATAHLPEPAILLVVITTVLGIVLGALGGRSRARREAAEAGAAAATA